jgi:L-2-hydroxyglutarate oxidase
MKYDYCVVGGGIVGLATAMMLLRARPGATLLVLEKEDRPAGHQSGHNSGVIHSGVYYQPGSLRARLCLRGAALTKEFCADNDIPINECGKLIVATNLVERGRLTDLAERAAANGVPAESLSRTELRTLEPNIDGLGALLVPSSGVVDYRKVAEAMAAVVQSEGGEIRYGVTVTTIRERLDKVEILAGDERFSADRLVACAGLQADRITRAAGLTPDFHTVPFRGEYYVLADQLRDFVHHLIYPVPDPALPFLGVHLTLTTDGGITVGPNAVLGLSREGYSRRSMRAQDVGDYLAFSGFWKFARGYVRTGAVELLNSAWKHGYLRECRKYGPSLTADDLIRGGAGIRAQAISRDGTLIHDFLFEQTPRMLHVCNAPSPAATSAIPIGEGIVKRLLATEGSR